MVGKKHQNKEDENREELGKIHTRLDRVERRLSFLEAQKQVIKRKYGTSSS